MTRCRTFAEPFTTIACGLSLAVLSPVLPWPPKGFRAYTLGLFGVLLSCCHPALTAMVASSSVAIGVAGFAWQLSLCEALADVGMSMHAAVFGVSVLLFMILFVFLPTTAGPFSLVFFLVPALGSLLLVLGVAEMEPSMAGISAHKLLSAKRCDADDPMNSRAARSLAAWALVWALGVSFQFYLARRTRLKAMQQIEGGGQPGGDLVQSLLPNAQEDRSMPRPDNKDDRYQLIVKAIFAGEGSDISHLTENEKKIVTVCREDEFERDRLVWGGGLI